MAYLCHPVLPWWMGHVFRAKLLKFIIHLASSLMWIHLLTYPNWILKFSAGFSPTKYPMSTLAIFSSITKLNSMSNWIATHLNSQSEICSHHFRRHHFAHRQEGQGWQDVTSHYIMAFILTSINGELPTKIRKIMNNYSCKMMSLNHWRWSVHTSTNRVSSLIIKTAGVSLWKEEQLSTTPLEDHQGEI